MRGHLASKGIHVSERCLRKYLPITQPEYHERRQNASEKIKNPKIYHAAGIGDKLHIYQNEKLVMFGTVHVIARDGFSGKIVAHSTMPVKNNLTIYAEILKLVYIFLTLNKLLQTLR